MKSASRTFLLARKRSDMRFKDLVGRRVIVFLFSFEEKGTVIYIQSLGEVLAIDNNMIAVKVDSIQVKGREAQKIEPPQLLWLNTLGANFSGIQLIDEG